MERQAQREAGTHTHQHTQTHGRNCSRKATSVQPIRQGLSGPLQALYIWWSYAGKKTWKLGLDFREVKMTHIGHTHIYSCQSFLVPFTDTLEAVHWPSSSCLEGACSRLLQPATLQAAYIPFHFLRYWNFNMF